MVARLNGVQEAVSSTLATRTNEKPLDLAVYGLSGGFSFCPVSRDVSTKVSTIFRFFPEHQDAHPADNASFDIFPVSSVADSTLDAARKLLAFVPA